MIKSALSQLIALVHFDQSLTAQQDQLHTLHKDVSKNKERISTLQQEIIDLQQQYHKAKSTVYQLEKKLDELSKQRRSQEKKLLSTINPKEYSALEQQIINLAQEEYSIEPSLEDAWRQQDHLSKAVVTLKINNDQQALLIETSTKEVQQCIDTLNNQLHQQTLERTNLCAVVPQELLEQYSTLQEKIKNPIVVLHNNTCSACCYIIPSQKINNIFLYKLEQCNNCFRLLYAQQLV